MVTVEEADRAPRHCEYVCMNRSDRLPVNLDAGAPACIVDLGIERNSERYRTLAEIAVGMGPEGLALDSRRRRGYVCASRSNAVTVFDLDDFTVLGEIPVGTEPIPPIFDEPTGRLFVANMRSHSVTVVDTRRGEVGEVVTEIEVGMHPAGMGYDPRRRLVLSGDTAAATVTVINADTLEKTSAVPAELGVGSIGVDVERGTAYCVNFFTRSVSLIDLATLEPVGKVAVRDGPCKVAVDPVHDLAYVANSLDSTVVTISLDTGEVADEIPVQQAPVGLSLSPDCSRLYVCNRGAGSVSVIGTADRVEWGRIPVGTAPGDCLADPETGRLFVSNAGSRSVMVLEDLMSGPVPLAARPHPLVGTRLPEFELPDMRTRALRHSREWSERKYILNFFASW